MSSSNLVRLAYKKEESYGVTPGSTKASVVKQDLTYTAKKGGELGNDITIRYVDGGTAGSEVVTVSDKAIEVSIDSGVSTALQIQTAVEANDDADALVDIVVSGTAGDAQDAEDAYATASLNLASDITLTASVIGTARNTKTFTLQVLAPAANPTNTVLISFTGTAAAIVCTVTPNDGTNNSLTPVTVTGANLTQLINTGLITAKNPTITDVSSFRTLQTAVGGNTTVLADGGEGDGVVGTFSGGDFDIQNLASGADNFKSARFTQEKYSGTPETTESAQIRTDRMSSGQVVTGLSVGGGHSFELAKEGSIEDFLESAMFNEWVSQDPVTGSFSLDLTTKKISRLTGSFITEGVKVGDFLKLSNFAVAGNNAIIMAIEVSALYVKFAHPTGMETATAESATYQIGDKLSIGTTKKSLTVEKTFLDLSEKAIIYKGMIVSQMELNVEYGSIITGSFETMGNDYDPVDDEDEFATATTWIEDAATTDSMNGSVDMPFVATDVTGSWDQDAFCLQSLKLTLNNNLTTLNCIGRAAPENYSPGTAQISAELSSYLKDANWQMLARKLSQESFGLGFMVNNTDAGGGWYGFFIPAIQVSFDDPASGGQNQEIAMDMKGTAKVGSAGESALTLYREPSE